MRNGLQVVFCILGISFLAGLALSRGSFAQQVRVRPVHQVVVVDSKGKIVGATLGGAIVHVSEYGPDNEVRPIVLLDVDRQLVAVNVARDRFYAALILYFDGPNCTGNAWYPPDSGERPPVLPRAAIGLPGQTLYVETTGATPQFVTCRSILINGRDCRNDDFSRRAVPMQPLVDLSTVFTPPFSLRGGP